VECKIVSAFNLLDLVLQELVKLTVVRYIKILRLKNQPEDDPTIVPKRVAGIIILYNLIKYKAVYDCIIYILYYILPYIQHNGDVSLENYKYGAQNVYVIECNQVQTEINVVQ
jgi:hypothetical protein